MLEFVINFANRCTENNTLKSSFTVLLLKMGLIGTPETSISNHLTVHSNLEDGKIHFNRGECLRSHIKLFSDYP